ncbi:hypothetical protein NECAME_13001 [Necator americanus]|uniref:G-protein coupled receptors family 1 profile domain-containing protein n=1 Tax=Necator americanus TaxID=51031 RepID=W2SXR5_NECAM|nr:hypothetical protein NECAME_13001 [Necator americanus]ETN74425.1 hypothetical protein NECAME_13001 [Necator americanus]
MEAIPDGTLSLLGLLLILMATIGICMCLVEIYEILRIKRILPFKYFTLSQAIIHFTGQSVVVILCIASQLIFGPWVYPPLVGYMALALQFASLYISLTMSVNRLISVSFPTRYPKVFTPTTAAVIAILACIFAFSTTSALLVDECNLNFRRDIGGFSFRDTDCGRLFSTYIDAIYSIALVLIAVPLDITSLFILRRISKVCGHVDNG